MNLTAPKFLLLILLTAFSFSVQSSSADRLRLVIETDAGGDPDDEQSLVRFLLYANEWDIEGIIANRPHARDGENLNPERTGIGIVRRQLNAYGQCWTNLVQNDSRYPTKDSLWSRTVPGDNNTAEAVNLLIATIDRDDPRPLWYSDWGTDHGAATNNLQRALNHVLNERGPEGYAMFKNKIRLSSANAFSAHTFNINPPFTIWVNTFEPELDRKRWYHRFSAITAHAGGFDLRRDVLTGHGPLGALYPTNTTHWQKEGDTMSFLYLVPTGMNNPDEPTWGSWAGRYALNPAYPDKKYYWANQLDAWNGTTNRDNTLARWAVALQNDFRTRLDWCVKTFKEANHPPVVKLTGPGILSAKSGDRIELDLSQSNDPDLNTLSFKWEFYPEPGTYKGHLEVANSTDARATVTIPQIHSPSTIHLIATVTDNGTPPLSRYQRVILNCQP